MGLSFKNLKDYNRAVFLEFKRKEVFMKKKWIFGLILAVLLAFGCSKSYKVKPLPFKSPMAYENVKELNGAQIAAKAFTDKTEANEAFGFDILGAGMLPVQVIFDNQGNQSLEIVGGQTFLEDQTGNLWPILSSTIAYERATQYARSENIVKEGTFHGLWGAAAGGIIGAAIGIVSGENIGTAAGKGAAIGGAAGATIGSAKGYDSNEARQEIITDLRDKSLKNKPVAPKSIAHGFLFFPGEANSAHQLRLQLKEKDTGKIHVLNLVF